MEENTQLPKEVVSQIEKDAEAAYVELYQKVLNLGDGFAMPKFNMITDPIEKVLTAYAAKLHQANETIKVLTYDNNRLKGEVEGLTSALDELRTKYDNILATESGHESKTENVWQSGYAAGHEAACERGKWEAQPGAKWVKASERLPGWKKRVKWRDGNNHSYATDGEISLFEMEKPNLEGWEWLDESPATFNPELFQIIRDAEVSKEEDLKAVKEVVGGAAAAGISQDAHEKEIMMQAFDKVRQIFVGRQWIMEGRGSYPYNDDRYQQEVRYMYDEFDQVVKDTWANIKSKSADYRKAIIAEYLESAAGREEAVAFADWLLEYGYEPSFEKKWVDYSKTGDNRVSSAQLYELFKQQKEK